MWDTAPEKILVALGAEPTEAVLEVAADEARLRGRGVHLVHVVAPTSGGCDAGTVVLGPAEDRLRLLLGDPTSISTELCRGPFLPTLVTMSARACLVVVSRDLTGPGVSSAACLVARSAAPVVVVPGSLDHTRRPRRPVVTVGVDDGETCQAVLREALEECEQRGACLRLVHARGDDRGTAVDSDEMIGRALEVSYDDVLASWPGVARQVVVAHGDAGEALLANALDSEMLLVGRHAPWLPLARQLGPTTMTVVERASCPVLVVDVHSMATAVLP